MAQAVGGNGGPEYAGMIDALRDFLDRVAGARPDTETINRLTGDLERWGAELAEYAVPEERQLFAHRTDLRGRGQTMIPPIAVTERDDTRIRGTVTFGRYFLGRGDAAHGGSIALVFDEVLGRFANLGGRRTGRTAYLNVEFRSVTPLDRELTVTGEFVKEEGRKRYLRGELWDGTTLCAEAEALVVELRPGAK
ncbi:PaaI family thioesterase [Melissospora conviva]|uniref:PaaI family thioesterase n=1 Tax=Melissospora conviva TaxID=3388432 RepID=UPI003C232A73